MYPFIYILGRPIGTYGICMLLGIILAGALALQRGKPRGLIPEDLLIVGATALGFGMIGGSLLYILVTYSYSELLSFLRQGNFSFLSSGTVFYGGLLGGILGALLGIRIAKCPISLIEYSVVPFIPLGHAIGRIGCVMAGCCHGFRYDGPLALYYPHSISGLPPDQGFFPVQLLESLLNVGICLILLHFGKKAKRPLDSLFLYLMLYAVVRFSLELLRGDSIRGGGFGLSTSQWVSISILFVCGVHFLIRRKQENN